MRAAGVSSAKAGERVNDCTTCDGSGVVSVLGCAAGCTLLRHAAECPVARSAECPACAKASLGEDLAS